jgi:SAM-dependent methyltransferase
MGDEAPEPQSWEQRNRVASETFVPWLDRIAPLAGSTVLEYGSGLGPVACAFAERAGRVIGYDIDAEAVEYAGERARERGLENVEAHVTTAEGIFDRVRAHAGEVDVFLLYAVLEHLTISERLEALRVAQEVVRPDGAIAVIETPNRLVASDYHGSQLPFFDQLPPELALKYVDRSERDDYRDAVLASRDADPDGGAMTLTRWGRGLSYHEFELVFGNLSERVIAGGYDPDLLPERSLHADELALARQLNRLRPDLPAPFSRYWLDLVISPRPVDPAAVRLIRPWRMETESSDRGKLTIWDTVAIGAGEPLTVRAPAPMDRVVCVVTVGAPEVEVTLRARRTKLRTRLRGEPTYSLIADFRLRRAVDGFTLTASEPAHIQFVGFELGSG